MSLTFTLASPTTPAGPGWTVDLGTQAVRLGKIQGLIENAEAGTVTSDATLTSVTFFDLGARFRVAGPISVGVVGFSAMGKADGTVSAKIPHPFFFSRDRSVSGAVTGLTRDELAVHLQATVIAPIGTRAQVMLFGGLFSSYILLRVGAPPGTWPHGWLNVTLGTHDLAEAKRRIARLSDAFRADGTRITENLDWAV